MTKTYYKNEYTEKQWRALIDEAYLLGCAVTYNRYGTCAEIDSTSLEDLLLAKSYGTRADWAEHIHNRLQKSTDFRVWRVEPKRRRKGYSPVIFKSQGAAEYEHWRLQRETGFEWKIVVKQAR